MRTSKKLVIFGVLGLEILIAIGFIIAGSICLNTDRCVTLRPHDIMFISIGAFMILFATILMPLYLRCGSGDGIRCISVPVFIISGIITFIILILGFAIGPAFFNVQDFQAVGLGILFAISITGIISTLYAIMCCV